MWRGLAAFMATCSFAGPLGAQPALRDVDVRASSEVGGYADSNHVYVITPTIAASAVKPTAGWSVSTRYLVDVVSAASADIVSTASRRWQEVRQAGSVDAAYKPGETGVALTANASHEPDYDSLTAGAAITRDLIGRNLTLLVGYNARHDEIGRAGTPFAVFSRSLDIHDFKGGATVILDRSTLLSFIGDVVIERGDPSKPYRYVPMFAPGTFVPRGAPVELVTQLRLSPKVLEQLPLSRDRYALAARMAHRFSRATLRVDERVYADSWGLSATTTDARALFDIGSRIELGPHVRFHAQTPVDFWQRAYVSRPGLDFPALRTGERELGLLASVTAGATARLFVGPSKNPRSWVLGADMGATETRYLDALYIDRRLSALGVLSLEVSF